MKTLKEALNEAGISFAHLARKSGISAQSVNQYKDYPAKLGSSSAFAYIEIFKDIEDELIYSKNGKLVTSAKYKLVRTFDL